MVFPIVGGDGKPTGYDIDNSLRLGPSGGGTTPHVNLRRTLGSAGTEETFTYSCWIKISAKSEYNYWLLGGSQETSSPNQATYFRISSNDKLRLSDGSVNLIPNRLFRDPNAWYHLVLAVDSTQGTASNRVKIYVNGVQETSFATETYPDQNLAFRVLENGVTQSIGTWIADDGTAYACDDAYISEVYLIDGQQLDSSYFGEFNDDGVWIPKDYTGTYGTHGFRFEFKQTGSSANSSGIGADTSGNDNHFSVNNSATTDITTDTPTNNFCTLNRLSYPSGLVTNLTEGNLHLLTTDSPYGAVPATFGLTNGKWYWEIKVNASSDYDRIGLVGTEVPITTSFDFGDTNLGGGAKTNLAYKSNDGKTRKDGTDANYGNTYTSGDIIGVAYNADDGDVYFYKNGTVQNSGTAAYTNLDGLTLMPAVGDGVANASGQYFCNFGNPAFAISSGNADANGYGNFEYAPPSGYYALCTKNLAEFG